MVHLSSEELEEFQSLESTERQIVVKGSVYHSHLFTLNSRELKVPSCFVTHPHVYSELYRARPRIHQLSYRFTSPSLGHSVKM